MQDKIDYAIKQIDEALGPSLFAVYLKGTYLMKEMHSKSDIDLVVIFKESARSAFNKIRGHEVFGNVSISGYSLEELRSGQSITSEMNPKTFMNNAKHFKLIKGNSVLNKGFPEKSDKEVYEDHKEYLKNTFLPKYLDKKHSLSDLCKQVLWLSFNELKVKGLNPKYSYKSIYDLLELSHIGRKAYKIRLGESQEDFVEELISYLA